MTATRTHLLRVLFCLALLCLAAPAVRAANAPRVEAFADLPIHAHSALLMDFATGKVLFEKNPDQPIPPASLTKLMTLHVAYKEIKAGRLRKSDRVHIPPQAYASRMPRPSSLMLLGPNQVVTVGELMLGLAVASGNDAAVALACHIAGSVGNFAARMNLEARNLGYTTMRFVDPSGLSPENTVTAREFADFCRRYIMMHPESLAELHSKREFLYPKPQNVLRAGKRHARIKSKLHHSRNILLGQYEGVDGLKPGYIRLSGNNLALTARRGDKRLVAVVLGEEVLRGGIGRRNLRNDCTLLLDYGFGGVAAVAGRLGERENRHIEEPAGAPRPSYLFGGP
jgi:D-alanyl-D-alanine carboxypeptidase (penicillin-binding protein 5/6)